MNSPAITAAVVLSAFTFSGCSAQSVGGPARLPVLASTTVPEGALTEQGYGQVRLSSTGLGLVSPGSPIPTSWTITQVRGKAGHWAINGRTLSTTPVVVSEGNAALTPAPTAAGVAVSLDGGPYVFRIAASQTPPGGGGAASLTIKIVPGAASWGNEAPSPAMLGSPAGSGIAKFQAAGGSRILYSVGADRSATRTIFSGFAFAPNAIGDKHVTIAYADATRPGKLLNLELSASSNITVDSFVASGDLGSVAVQSIFGVGRGSTDITLNNPTARFTAATAGARTSVAAILFSGAKNIVVNNLQAFGVWEGIADNQSSDNQNITINGATVRGYFDNAFWMGNGVDFTWNDIVAIAPTRIDIGKHLDSFQIADGASPTNLTVNRAESYQAEGTGNTQGLFFGGNEGIFTGSISNNGDGTGTLRLDRTNGIQVLPRNPLVIPGYLPTTILRQTGGRPYGVGVYQVDVGQTVPAGTTIYTRAPLNMRWNGVLSDIHAANSVAMRGNAGTSFYKNFTSVKSNTGPMAGVSFLGRISGNDLTIASLRPVSMPTGFEAPISIMSKLPRGYLQANQPIALKLGGKPVATIAAVPTPAGGVPNEHYTLTTAPGDISRPTLMYATSDAETSNNNPSLSTSQSDQPALNTGTMTVASGFMHGGGGPGYITGARHNGSAPASFDIGRRVSAQRIGTTIFANGNIEFEAKAFASGKDPETCLNAIPPATWAKYSVAQVKAAHNACLLPKIGGPLDAGGGVFYGGIKNVSGTAVWNDGSNKTP